jgi:hypothetical protein
MCLLSNISLGKDSLTTKSLVGIASANKQWRKSESWGAEMARYRWLQDGYVNGAYYHAGDIMQTADDWVPSAALDPLDTAAVTALYNAGPQTMPLLIRQQWSHAPVSPPLTYWKQIPGTNKWQLTGLGSGYPSISM